MATVTVQGADALSARLQAAGKAIKPVFTEAMREATALLRKEARVYPPKLPNQKYVRTFRLRRGWKVTRAEAEGGEVANVDVPYNIYVQDAKTQATIHRGRWSTDESLATANQTKIVEIFNKAVDKALK